MSPDLSDEKNLQEEQGKLDPEAQPEAHNLANEAGNLSQQVKDDKDFLFGKDSPAADSQSNGFNEMAQNRLDEGIQNLDKANDDFQAAAKDLPPDEAKLLDDLGAGLRDAWSDDSQLKKSQDDIEKAVDSLREQTANPMDPKASDEDFAARADAQNRQETLEKALDVAKAADQLLNDVHETSITVIPRQEIGDPNTTDRKSSEQMLGDKAQNLVDAQADEKYQCLHLLARCFGGEDLDKNAVTGNAEPHKDMSRVEGFANKIRDDARVEVEINCMHKGVEYGDDVKERNGYELRFQAWVSDKDAKPDPDRKADIDMTFDLQSNARDESLKPIFDQLKEVRKSIQEGISPSQAIRQLDQLMNPESPQEEEERLKRIKQETTGGELD